MERQPFVSGQRPPPGGGRDFEGMGMDMAAATSHSAAAAPTESTSPPAPATPSISLPTGGGAIRSTDEKFGVNASTGTGSLSLPVTTSSGRGSFDPQLSLSYDSGQGNGPFGMGWQFSLPAVTRKTSNGVPLYRDCDESDVFLLSGAEDLVPLCGPAKREPERRGQAGRGREKRRGGVGSGGGGGEVGMGAEAQETRSNYGSGNNRRDPHLDHERKNKIAGFGVDNHHDNHNHNAFHESVQDGYTVRRYRPRVEGLFARIERWTRHGDRDVHWRSISRDNITSVYGVDSRSRILDPADEDAGHPERVFSWLISHSYDSKGNAIVYEYKAEDSAGVCVSQPCERNRNEEDRSANRHLKCIKYGNRKPNRDSKWTPTDPQRLPDSTWMFKVVFDYGEHAKDNPTPAAQAPWRRRRDPFSSYRSGFEIRTYRLCRRILMFHCFPDELGQEDYLVHSMDLTYKESSIASFVTRVTKSMYSLQTGTRSGVYYSKKSMPPLDLEYTEMPDLDQLARLPVQDIDHAHLENLPYGVDETNYQWVDLHGEGLPGIFSAQAEGWYYTRNLSTHLPAQDRTSGVAWAKFGPVELLDTKPNAAAHQIKFIDLAADGQIDVVQFEGPVVGFNKRTIDGHWLPFHPFHSWPNIDFRNPNIRFVDLNGDGRADILLTENEVFTWYPSRGEEGFGDADWVRQSFDEERAPRLVFADAAQSIYLADFCGDGLIDIARVCNGEVCYWPSLGYGCFGPKVSMDNAPWFDNPDRFDQRRIRLADIDGSGIVDLLYLGSGGIDVYLNQAGNSWSQPERLTGFSHVDSQATVTAIDLFGTGTTCIVWSSLRPGDTRRSMRYLDLMQGQKPHLLTRVVNNLGAETCIRYAPSTQFYLQDQQAATPWITRLPFPVQCVERVESYDRISCNRFVSRYAYHHGHYDGVEQEFRGFGMVEQWDTEDSAAWTARDLSSRWSNQDQCFRAAPVHTKTWFHTGIFAGHEKISRQLAHEYYSADSSDEQDSHGFQDTLLEDTVLPSESLSTAELREACRSLRGRIVRQETYANDSTAKSSIPYLVSEQNYTIKVLQGQGINRHAVFLAHDREALSYHYERNLDDPRVQHKLTLLVDGFGNILKSATVGYARRPGRSPLLDGDRRKQEQLLITYRENDYTNVVDTPYYYSTPMPCESRTYEVTGLTPDRKNHRFELASFQDDNCAAIHSLKELPFEQDYGSAIQAKRLIDRKRILYRSDDMTRLLPKGQLEPLLLQGEAYKLAFTPGLISTIFQGRADGHGIERLIPDPEAILGGQGVSGAGYVDLDHDRHWWIPSGRISYTKETAATPAEEWSEARDHFFLTRRVIDPFGESSTVDYDRHRLLLVRTQDAVGNTTESVNDYRVLRPKLVVDANGNRSAASFDTLGMVVGTAVMGKTGERVGDSLENFQPDVTDSELDQFFRNPKGPMAATLLGNATTRFIYDVNRYWLTRSSHVRSSRPTYTAVLARETHACEMTRPGDSRIQMVFSYSDGFSRILQKKVPAKPGPIREGGQVTSPRWIGTGWTIFNNKGKPVRQYEPFFDDTHDFRSESKAGVSSVVFYDPMDRVVATLRPNHSWEKAVFDPWYQRTYDVNDMLAQSDPRKDKDVGHFFCKLKDDEYLPTWYDARKSGQLGPHEQRAAAQAILHANTPLTVHFDSLGRTFLSIDDNGAHGRYYTRSVTDIQGHQRDVLDDKGRSVMRYDYDMLGNIIHQASMEAGERWLIRNVVGGTLFSWDSRAHRFRNVYDAGQRLLETHVRKGSQSEVLVERAVYGESAPNASRHNLRGQMKEIHDQAGVVFNDQYDFNGNLVQGRRQLALEYKDTLDWSGQVALKEEFHHARTSYDALNRVVDQVAADGSLTRREYNEFGLLERLLSNPQGEQVDGQPAWREFVRTIDYDAKKQRTRIEYGNGTHTTYAYDKFTFKLARLRTCSGSERLQDLEYVCDPIGNVAHIHDDAQQSIFFRNQRVDPSCDYSYDAIYRLVEASGREHVGQTNGQPIGPTVPTASGIFHGRMDHPGDGKTVARYWESYRYDSVGNLLSMTHRGSDSTYAGWKRRYVYEEPSQLESEHVNNRLTATIIGNKTEKYRYEGNDGLHGNMTSMPHLPRLSWDYKDELRSTTRQTVRDGGTAETTYYVYDGRGQRVRKLTECQASAGTSTLLVRERIYLGGFEIFHEYDGKADGPSLQRDTLHIMDGLRRFAMVESRVQGSDESAVQLTRFQFDNHLGSSSIELDEQGRIISYEEYFPYGSTAYQAVRSRTETPKRYRFTGKERDEESGLYYHGARYFASWLGRWASCDPSGLRDGINVFAYVGNNPVSKVDPTGNYEIDWGEVAIGAGIAVLTVGAIALTAGVAVPAILAAAGVSAATIETVGVTAAVAGTAYGLYGVQKTSEELITGRNRDTGKELTNVEASRRLGALPVEVVATAFGARALTGGGGGGTPPLAEPVFSGRMVTPEGFTLDVAPPIFSPAPAIPIPATGAGTAIGTGAGAPELVMSMMSGGGGGGGRRGRDDDEGGDDDDYRRQEKQRGRERRESRESKQNQSQEPPNKSEMTIEMIRAQEFTDIDQAASKVFGEGSEAITDLGEIGPVKDAGPRSSLEQLGYNPNKFHAHQYEALAPDGTTGIFTVFEGPGGVIYGPHLSSSNFN